MTVTPDDIHFPPYQGHCVKVSVINGAKAHMLSGMLVHPAPESQKYMNIACFSFLIESSHCDQKVLFDLAFMKDPAARMPPALKASFGGGEVMVIDEFLHIRDTIKAHGIDLSAINAIIWSHAHTDHVGDPSVFPPSTELVVSPGLKKSCMPGYPINPDSFLLGSAFQGRNVREIAFSTSTTAIGGFRAVDFFHDSAFWLLDAPGHTEHHICALCRTTEESWLLLGGDACHSIAQLRPNQFRSLPDTMPASILGSTPPPEQCSCAHMSRLARHTKHGSLYDLAPGMHEDLTKAEETVEMLKAFDGRDDVMIAIAHDATLLDVLDLFPQDVNGWKARGWADQARWLFLKELEGVATASS
jgi:glyoxylase-like metal-dependent hydrolase (beta-lactamase superfamily II)